MKFLLIFPVIYAVGMLVVIVAVLCSKKSTGTGSSTPIDCSLPDGKEYGQPGISNRDNPTIAEQYDTRITNVFKNPMEGIL